MYTFRLSLFLQSLHIQLFDWSLAAWPGFGRKNGARAKVERRIRFDSRARSEQETDVERTGRAAGKVWKDVTSPDDDFSFFIGRRRGEREEKAESSSKRRSDGSSFVPRLLCALYSHHFVSVRRGYRSTWRMRGLGALKSPIESSGRWRADKESTKLNQTRHELTVGCDKTLRATRGRSALWGRATMQRATSIAIPTFIEQRRPNLS